MPKPVRRHALIDHRPWLLASLFASASYFFLADGVPGLFSIVWKGLGVGFLAVYAASRIRGPNRWTVTALFGLCSVADMVLDISFLFGAAIFALAHCVGIALYWRHLRERRAPSQTGAAVAIVLLVPAIAALITFPVPNWHLATGYAAILALMSGLAWASAFPRYRVGVGTLLFVASDLVIFARETGRLDPDIAGWLVWPLYYVGQLMIATGVVQTLRKRMASGLHR